MRFERDDAKVGLLVFAAAALFLGLVLHRSLANLVKKETRVKVRLSDTTGLETGTEVRLQGLRVGQVNGIELRREGAEYYFLATLGLRPDIVLWKGTFVQVASSGLGSAYIDLDLPPLENRSQELEPDAILIGETGASLGSLVAAVQTFVEDLDASLNELRGGLKEKGPGLVLDHPPVRKVLLDLDAALVALRGTAMEGRNLLERGRVPLETLDRSLSSLEKSAAVVEELLGKRAGTLDDSIGNLDALLKELLGLSSDLHVLLKDGGPEVENSLRALRRDLEATEELLELLKGKPSRLLWGTPSASEKAAARKRVEERRQRETPPPAP